jgi:hypothetical protein
VRIDRGGAPGAAYPTAESPPLAHVVERLLADFDSQLAPPVVAAVVKRCRIELDVVPRAALPELVERLASFIGLNRVANDRRAETRRALPDRPNSRTRAR